MICCKVVGNRARKKCSVANNAFPPFASYQVSHAAWVLKPIFNCDTNATLLRHLTQKIGIFYVR